MPAVSRETDTVSTGHACDTITTLDGTNTGTASNVYMNGLSVCCVGDKTVVHNIKSGSSCVPHIEFIKNGSSSVFIGGKAVARIGDSCDAGVITSGSGNVFCN